MGEWNKGVVFVNGFNIGRYMRCGPPRTLYIPAPLLKHGDNVVRWFVTSKIIFNVFMLVFVSHICIELRKLSIRSSPS